MNQKTNFQITADTSIKEILSLGRNTAAVLMANGMSCVGCSLADEPLSIACRTHGADVDQVLSDLEEYLLILSKSNL